MADDQHGQASDAGGPGDTGPGPYWWRASDGQLYPPDAKHQPGPGWWWASDGRWYPPEAQPGRPRAAPKTTSEARWQTVGWTLVTISLSATVFAGLLGGEDADHATQNFAYIMITGAVGLGAVGLACLWRSKAAYRSRNPSKPLPFAAEFYREPPAGRVSVTNSGRHSVAQLASPSLRFAARLLDVGFVGGVVGGATALVAFSLHLQHAVLVVLGTSYLALAVYESVALAVWGTTVGKRHFGLLVVPLGTSPRLPVGRAIFRTVLLFVMGYLILPIPIDLAWICWDRQGQFLHDKVGQTLVVRKA